MPHETNGEKRLMGGALVWVFALLQGLILLGLGGLITLLFSMKADIALMRGSYDAQIMEIRHLIDNKTELRYTSSDASRDKEAAARDRESLSNRINANFETIQTLNREVLELAKFRARLEERDRLLLLPKLGAP